MNLPRSCTNSSRQSTKRTKPTTNWRKHTTNCTKCGPKSPWRTNNASLESISASVSSENRSERTWTTTNTSTKSQTTEMDPTKCFLQITKIDPYIFPEETRKTFFEFNTNLSNFVFETPYTLSGKSHADDISGQFKKKTIITISGSFPSIVNRLPVIKKRD